MGAFPHAELLFESEAIAGWSEKHWWGADAPNLSVVLSDALALGKTRAQMLAVGVRINAVRVAFETPARTVLFDKTLGQQGLGLPYNPAMTGRLIDEEDVCLTMRLAETGGRQKSVFLAGQPDDVVVRGRFAPPAGHPYPGVLNDYFGALRGGFFNGAAHKWGWKGLTPAPGATEHKISSIGRSAVGTPLTITTADPHGFVEGDKVIVRGIRLKPGSHKIVGRFIVDVLGTTGFTLRGTEDYAVTGIITPGFVRKVEYVFLAYDLLVSVTASERKRGGVFLLRRGKRRTAHIFVG